MDWLYLLLYVVIAYLIGSIPTGYILVKSLKGIDIRTVGSGSTGATNVKRVLGTKYFFIVMTLDALKGLIPLMVIGIIGYTPSIIPGMDILKIIIGIMLVIGHSKSIYLNFSGGKSVATSIGVLLGLCWQVALITVLIWIIIVYLTKYVSLGSIVASLLSPLLMWLFNQPLSYVLFMLITAMYLSFYLHRDNIKRLWLGTENKISFSGDNK